MENQHDSWSTCSAWYSPCFLHIFLFLPFCALRWWFPSLAAHYNHPGCLLLKKNMDSQALPRPVKPAPWVRAVWEGPDFGRIGQLPRWFGPAAGWKAQLLGAPPLTGPPTVGLELPLAFVSERTISSVSETFLLCHLSDHMWPKRPGLRALGSSLVSARTPDLMSFAVSVIIPVAILYWTLHMPKDSYSSRVSSLTLSNNTMRCV